jgi:hypothetical protein
MKKSAIISDCSTYRYELHREWDKKKGKVLFIMLNPSTADSNEDDLTTIRCMNFAKRWGYGGLMIGNIYPFRAKRPKDLRAWKIFGERYSVYKTNVAHVQDMMSQCDLTVCAWGCNHKGIPHMLEYTSGLHYLELCDDGLTPKHPLGNLSNDLKPRTYKLNTIING